MEWVAGSLHITSKHGVSSITTADAHTSAASSRLNWRSPARFKWTRPFRAKDEIWFLPLCHYISNAVYCEIIVIVMDFGVFLTFTIHGIVHRSMTNSNNQQDAP